MIKIHRGRIVQFCFPNTRTMKGYELLSEQAPKDTNEIPMIEVDGQWYAMTPVPAPLTTEQLQFLSAIRTLNNDALVALGLYSKATEAKKLLEEEPRRYGE